jgi:basic membrane protein A
MVFAFVGCAKTETYELAMVTDIGTIDDKSFNQGTWEGLEKYATEKEISHKYYKPTEKTTDAYLAAIDLAIQGGAKVVVTPGFLFEPAIFKAQDLYPETKFVLIDGFPQDGTYTEFRIEENVYSIFYAEQQAGFLSGYAAVKDGFTKLGFVGGMAVPAVVRYGYGFVQGAEYAAKEMDIDVIELKYTYTGDFAATPENQTLAASWYEAGTEVIFAAAGGAGSSVMAAAEAAGAKVIGVDVDQAPESETVITSAMKQLGFSVYNALTGYYADEFKGGVSESLDVTVDGVALPMETSRFETFTQADYDAVFAALVADTDGIASSILTDTDVESADQIETSIVSVEVIGE